MNRPSLFHWLTRWAIGSFACVVLIATGLAIANAIDYAPYGLALRRTNGMTHEDLEALAAVCTRHEQHGHQRLFGDDIPAEFRGLKPVRVSIYPGSSDISLLEKGDERYIFIRVSTSKENQEIDLISYSGIKQESHRLWERHPEFTRRLNPAGRIVTIAQWDMRSGREWIVLKDRLLVVDRHTTVGESDQIAANFPLKAEDRSAIENAIVSLPTEVHGRAFDAGAMDGISLRVSFSPDGTPNQSTDIVLANSWRGELSDLVEVISKAVGKECAIPFPGIVERMDIQQGQPPPINLPLPEYDRRRSGTRLPWWCWWPRLSLLHI
ncbi:MAG: hypothetical protein HZA31_04590 [Opitutae bacterium]|nr:hypothetical protein [Opitutae bacterium]